MSARRVDGARLLGRLAALAEVGATPTGGVTRVAFSPAAAAGRRLVAGWMAEAGLDVEVDGAGNLVGRSRGTGPTDLGALVTGSHLDTVLDAGPLDGAYGVVAAVEVATVLAEAGTRLRHPLWVVAFEGEEGVVGPPFWGSSAVAGRLPGDETGPDAGATGPDPVGALGAAWPPGAMAACIELHIEQGPVLEAAGVAIGVVDGITARWNVDVVVGGQANHAGTTPMALRRDALRAAAEVVAAVAALAEGDGPVRVATVGALEIAPGVRNVVPGAAVVRAELRDLDPTRLAEAQATLERVCAGIAERTDCALEVRVGPRSAPVECDPGLRSLVRQAAATLGLTSIDLPSGAGHDAQQLAGLGPVGMIFVPSAGGVSHSPAERSDPAHLVAGADVLLGTILAADATPTPAAASKERSQ